MEERSMRKKPVVLMILDGYGSVSYTHLTLPTT